MGTNKKMLFEAGFCYRRSRWTGSSLLKKRAKGCVFHPILVSPRKAHYSVANHNFHQFFYSGELFTAVYTLFRCVLAGFVRPSVGPSVGWMVGP